MQCALSQKSSDLNLAPIQLGENFKWAGVQRLFSNAAWNKNAMAILEQNPALSTSVACAHTGTYHLKCVGLCAHPKRQSSLCCGNPVKTQ